MLESTIAVSDVGTCTSRDAPQERRGDVPREVAHDASADRDYRVAALDAVLREPLVERGRRREALARLPRGEGEHPHLDARAVQRALRRPAVRMHHVAVAHDPGAPGEARGREPASQFVLQRVPPHVDRVGAGIDCHRGGERGVAAPRSRRAELAPRPHDLVRRLFDAQGVRGDSPVRERVRPLPLALERFDARERVVGAQHRTRHRLGALSLGDARQPREDGVGPRLQRDDEPGAEHRVARLVPHHGAGACRDDDALAPGEVGDGGALHLAERRLSVLREDALDGLAGALHDQLVGVGELPTEQPRRAPPHGALPHAGKPDEKDAVAHARFLARSSASVMVTASNPRLSPAAASTPSSSVTSTALAASARCAR